MPVTRESMRSAAATVQSCPAGDCAMGGDYPRPSMRHALALVAGAALAALGGLIVGEYPFRGWEDEYPSRLVLPAERRFVAEGVTGCAGRSDGGREAIGGRRGWLGRGGGCLGCGGPGVARSDELGATGQRLGQRVPECLLVGW